jgi:hypothetical protein
MMVAQQEAETWKEPGIEYDKATLVINNLIDFLLKHPQGICVQQSLKEGSEKSTELTRGGLPMWARESKHRFHCTFPKFWMDYSSPCYESTH